MSRKGFVKYRVLSGDCIRDHDRGEISIPLLRCLFDSSNGFYRVSHSSSWSWFPHQTVFPTGELVTGSRIRCMTRSVILYIHCIWTTEASTVVGDSGWNVRSVTTSLVGRVHTGRSWIGTVIPLSNRRGGPHREGLGVPSDRLRRVTKTVQVCKPFLTLECGCSVRNRLPSTSIIYLQGVKTGHSSLKSPAKACRGVPRIPLNRGPRVWQVTESSRSNQE